MNILEVTVENKNYEVNNLKQELSKAFAEIETLKCDLKEAQQNHLFCQACDYKAVTDVHLKEHIKMKHEPSCKFCELKFESIESLEKHTCKQNIINAEFNQF